jgi:hypothetical protein
MKGYNTNLAAEFHVLSVLHRLGAEANLTLGNKKSVDVAIVRGAGDAITVDVKGLAGKTGWPVDNFRERKGHFVILLSFLDKIDDPGVVPEVYIVPSQDIPSLIYHAPSGRKVIPLGRMRKEGKRFLEAWRQLL